MQLPTTVIRRLSRRTPWKFSAQLTTKSFLCRIPRPQNSSNINSLLSPSRYNYDSQVAQRSFTTSTVRHSSESFHDPNRPDLFYHIVPGPTPISKRRPSYALSFSPSKPPSSTSATIIGWLPAQKNTSNTDVKTEDATLTDFVENPAFRETLHSVIKDALMEGVDEVQKAMAMQIRDGWMHIHDQRNIPALNRIGDPDDIIGTVLVENSEIRSETYQPMPAYRLVTSDGLMQLTPGLFQALQKALARTHEVEMIRHHK